MSANVTLKKALGAGNLVRVSRVNKKLCNIKNVFLYTYLAVFPKKKKTIMYVNYKSFNRVESRTFPFLTLPTSLLLAETKSCYLIKILAKFPTKRLILQTL